MRGVNAKISVSQADLETLQKFLELFKVDGEVSVEDFELVFQKQKEGKQFGKMTWDAYYSYGEIHRSGVYRERIWQEAVLYKHTLSQKNKHCYGCISYTYESVRTNGQMATILILDAKLNLKAKFCGTSKK